MVAASFLLPLALWCIVSYVPFVWHPQIEVVEPGSVDYLQVGMRVDREQFESERVAALAAGVAPPEGVRSNPIYLPAPHEVVSALFSAFGERPDKRSEEWLHVSLMHSVSIIAWGFILSCLFGLPLGVLCGTYPTLSHLIEPFVEFFRYFPAPAFGALCVAILGIYDAPKIAIIFIGTFFQLVLITANTARGLAQPLIDAAQTLGANHRRILLSVVLPGSAPRLFRDLRILLGWAWTYLIVAELVGSSSGITWFITQQARYKNFDEVFAAILVIGLIGLLSDVLLAWLGRRLFPWESRRVAAGA
ncbi:MAG: ABC transporter permease [Pseudomonadota bacterium]